MDARTLPSDAQGMTERLIASYEQTQRAREYGRHVQADGDVDLAWRAIDADLALALGHIRTANQRVGRLHLDEQAQQAA